MADAPRDDPRWVIAICETCDLPIRVRFDDDGEVAQVFTTCAEPKPDTCPAVLARKS